jgi:hypothetical protein
VSASTTSLQTSGALEGAHARMCVCMQGASRASCHKPVQRRPWNGPQHSRMHASLRAANTGTSSAGPARQLLLDMLRRQIPFFFFPHIPPCVHGFRRLLLLLALAV